MKNGGKIIVTMMVAALALTGCGKASVTEETEVEPSDEGEQGGEMMIPNDGKGELISDEDAAPLQYMKKYMVEDVYGDGSSYEVYAPDGSDSSDGFLSYIDHGISFFASVFGGEEEELPYFMLNESVKGQKEDWESSEQYSEVQFSGVVKNGADRYVTASAKSEDVYGTAYAVKKLYYLDVPKPGVCVLWEIEVTEVQTDGSTAQLLAELGQCYGIGLESIMPDGGWAQADAARQVEAQDVYEPEAGELVLSEVEGYQYLGMATLFLKDGEIQCPAMAPMGYATTVKESYISASMHGVSVSISSTPTGTDMYVPLMREGADKLYKRKLEDESVENRNVHKSEVMEMSGYDQAWYYIVDYETPDRVTEEYYKEVSVNCRIVIAQEYVLTCDITLRDNQYDASTNALLKELETAYGIDLSAYYNEEAGTEPAAAETQDGGDNGPVTMADLLQESGNVLKQTDAPELPDTVLWFNASYACLTYANGWDWRWVGGFEPTEENAQTAQYFLYSSWQVTDRESGIEVVNKLLDGGHRAECRKCMDELEEWGLLQLDGTRFGEEVLKITEGGRTDIDLGDAPGRYVLAYYMYHKGMEPEYIAAWDLCRVNELYANFYLCGFMDYEEAMDASLENSLRLQKMYDSWDEMVEAYLFGYQFWQADLGGEDSPTQERRSYYEMLKNSSDNPYELDWNMELKKSW